MIQGPAAIEMHRRCGFLGFMGPGARRGCLRIKRLYPSARRMQTTRLKQCICREAECDYTHHRAVARSRRAMQVEEKDEEE